MEYLGFLRLEDLHQLSSASIVYPHGNNVHYATALFTDKLWPAERLYFFRDQVKQILQQLNKAFAVGVQKAVVACAPKPLG